MDEAQRATSTDPTPIPQGGGHFPTDVSLIPPMFWDLISVLSGSVPGSS